MNNNGSDLLRSSAAGVVAGIAGTAAMDAISAAWTLARKGTLKDREATLVHQGGRPDVEASKQGGRDAGDHQSVATTAIADRVAEPVLHRPLTRGERHSAGTIVHYSFGTLTGGVYGALSTALPAVSVGKGVPFGLAVWATAVLMALPAMRLTAPPKTYSTRQHIFGIVTHIGFGFITALVHRGLTGSGQRP